MLSRNAIAFVIPSIYKIIKAGSFIGRCLYIETIKRTLEYKIINSRWYGTSFKNIYIYYTVSHYDTLYYVVLCHIMLYYIMFSNLI